MTRICLPTLSYHSKCCNFSLRVFLTTNDKVINMPRPGRAGPVFRHDQLNLWSLEERRNRSDLIEVFKMAKNLSPIPLNKFFELNTDNRTRGHSLKLVKHRCNCEVRRHFSERVVSRWNISDQATISAKTVNGFKSKLELERKRKMGLFLDWSLLGLMAVFNLLERPDLWVTWPVSISRSRYYSTPNNLKMVQDRAIVTTNNGRPIEIRIWSVELRHFQWTWTTDR